MSGSGDFTIISSVASLGVCANALVASSVAARVAAISNFMECLPDMRREPAMVTLDVAMLADG